MQDNPSTSWQATTISYFRSLAIAVALYAVAVLVCYRMEMGHSRTAPLLTPSGDLASPYSIIAHQDRRPANFLLRATEFGLIGIALALAYGMHRAKTLRDECLRWISDHD